MKSLYIEYCFASDLVKCHQNLWLKGLDHHVIAVQISVNVDGMWQKLDSKINKIIIMCGVI